MGRILTAGKWRSLATLCDERGILKMLATDQRGSTEQALAESLGRAPTYEELARFKRLLVRHLGPYATAVLTDPEYGYGASVREFPGQAGLLMAYERSGYLKAGESARHRRMELLEGWSAARARRAGASAIKLLLYYRPDGDPDVNAHQAELCRQVGEECAAEGLAFLAEVLAYPLEEPGADSREYARRRTELGPAIAAEFSRPEYGADVLKLEFPGDLKYTREYCGGAFDGRQREPAYSLAELEAACRALDGACRLPWVLLSAGVGIGEFLRQLELATAAGASGFMCGRAIWKGALPLFGDEAAAAEFLAGQASVYMLQCCAAAEAARPLWEHPALEDGEVEHAGPGWHLAG